MNLDSNKIEEIWGKATEIAGYDSSRWRKDFAGAWIQREQYGLPTELGWEIFHLIPVSQGGTSDVENLLPIHRQNNLRRSNNYPMFHTAVTAKGDKNVSEDQIWRIEQLRILRRFHRYRRLTTRPKRQRRGPGMGFSSLLSSRALP